MIVAGSTNVPAEREKDGAVQTVSKWSHASMTIIFHSPNSKFKEKLFSLNQHVSFISRQSGERVVKMPPGHPCICIFDLLNPVGLR